MKSNIIRKIRISYSRRIMKSPKIKIKIKESLNNVMTVRRKSLLYLIIALNYIWKREKNGSRKEIKTVIKRITKMIIKKIIIRAVILLLL